MENTKWSPDFTVAEAVAYLDQTLLGSFYRLVYAAQDRAKTERARKRLAYLLSQYDRDRTYTSDCECCGYVEHDCYWDSHGFVVAEAQADRDAALDDLF